MKPINFPEATIKIAEDQPEYQTLPSLVRDGPEGEVISCWQLSFWERLQILFVGKLWVSLWTFRKPLTPSYFTVNKSELIVPANIWYLHKRIRVRAKKLDVNYYKYLLEYKFTLFQLSFWVKGEYIFHFTYEGEPLFSTGVITDLFTKRRKNSLQRSAARREMNAFMRESNFYSNPYQNPL